MSVFCISLGQYFAAHVLPTCLSAIVLLYSWFFSFQAAPTSSGIKHHFCVEAGFLQSRLESSSHESNLILMFYEKKVSFYRKSSGGGSSEQTSFACVENVLGCFLDDRLVDICDGDPCFTSHWVQPLCRLRFPAAPLLQNCHAHTHPPPHPPSSSYHRVISRNSDSIYL